MTSCVHLCCSGRISYQSLPEKKKKTKNMRMNSSQPIHAHTCSPHFVDLMTFLVITHEFRSRKVKKNSSKEIRKFPFNLSLYSSQTTVRVHHRIFFQMKNYKYILKLATLLMIENPLFPMQIGSGHFLHKKLFLIAVILSVMHYTSFGSVIKRN